MATRKLSHASLRGTADIVNRARGRLDQILDSVFEAEQQRFVTALGPMADTNDLASELRRAAHAATRLVSS